MRSVKPGSYIFSLFKITLLFVIMAGKGMICNAQEVTDYEEVPVFFNIQRVGTTEMQALIIDEKAFLPVLTMFDFLKIKITTRTPELVSGTFIQQESEYTIDQVNNRVIYLGKTYDLKPNSLIKTADNLYMRSEYFGEIFGLNCVFNFRNLSVVLSTDIELPILREMRQEQMRNNLGKLRGVFAADTIIGRSKPAFHFGSADYAFVTSGGNDNTPRDTRLSLGLGGIIAGGETNVILNYHNNQPFDRRQQYYLWRYVDNSNTYVKQLSIGKIRSQSISSIFAPVVGVQVTNSPTTYRRSFGTYVLSNYTEPNWTVELYVNGVLINYVKADAAGFYTFNVPLVYGNTNIKLRLYGPFGEERSTEQNINIPFNFLPKNEFEYTASGGIVEDGHDTRFARFSSNYGLNRHITVGAGFEYLSSITSGSKIPYVNTSFRLLPNLLVSGEYDYNVRSRAVLSYNLPSGLQFEFYNNWYKKGQTAINNTFLEEHKAILSIPIRGKVFSAFTRLSLQDIRLANSRYSTAEWMLSGVVGNVNASATTYAFFMPDNNNYIYSVYSLGIRVLRNILINQKVQYEYNSNQVITLRTELEKRIFVNGYLNLSYEKNYISDINNIEFGVRYDFSFAQTRTSIRKTNDDYRTLQGISGSLIHDGKSGLTQFNNYTSIGKGAILLIPYLDLNGNGKRERGEPRAKGLKIVANGGRIKRTKDNSILVTDLEAYANCNIELDPSGFDHVSWKLLKKNYSVLVSPNFVKNIEIPVSVFGEVSGQIVRMEGDEEKGIGGIGITIYNEKGVEFARTKSEFDGYFSYMGLLPGKYTAKIDIEKVKELGMVTDKTSFNFTIVRNIEGSFVDDLMFKLTQAN